MHVDVLKKRPVFLLGAIAFLLQYVSLLLIVSSTTLFLRRVGAPYLPHAYVFLNVIGIGLQLFMLTRKGFSTYRVARQMTAGVFVLVLLSIPFLGTRFAAFFFVLFLLVRLYDILVFTYFLTYTQSVFPVREAKHRISQILGASSASCIIAGFSVRPLLAVVNLEVVFVLIAAMAAAMLLLLTLAARLWPPPVIGDDGARGKPEAVDGNAPAGADPAVKGKDRAPGEARVGDEETDASGTRRDGGAGWARLRKALKVLRTSPLAANVVKVLLLATFLRYLVDFQYNKAIATAFPDEEDLASFIGFFISGCSVITMIVQFFLTGRLLAWLKTGGVMCIAPGVQIVLAACILAFPAPALIILSQAFWGLGFHGATRPAFNILLVPLEASTRDRVSLLSTMAGSLGSLVAGLVLLALQNVMDTRQFFGLIGGLYVAYLFIARQLDGNYLEVLRRRIAGSDSAAKIEALKSLGFLGAGRDREHLARLLSDDDAQVRQEAIRRLTALSAKDAQDLALGVIESERSVRNLATLAQVLPDVLAERTVPLLRDLLDRTPDDRVRANVIDALGRLGDESAVAIVLPFLEDGNNRVRANALLALARLAKERGLLDRALDALVGMLRTDDRWMRASALAAMGDLREPCFSACLVSSLDDPLVEVRRNAVRSLGKLRSAEALPRLSTMAEKDPEGEIRALAAEVCRLIEDEKVDELVRLARRLTREERNGVGDFLKHAGKGPKMEVLYRLLRTDFPVFPTDLLNAVHLADDARALAALAASLDGDPPQLGPLARHAEVAPPEERAGPMRLLAALGAALPAARLEELVRERLRLLCLLHAVKDVSAAQGRPRAVEEAEAARVRCLSGLLLWAAVFGPLGDETEAESRRTAIGKALQGALSEDGHLASMAIDFLESRLHPAFAGPVTRYLEAVRRSEGPSRFARECLDAWRGHPERARRALEAADVVLAEDVLARSLTHVLGGDPS